MRILLVWQCYFFIAFLRILFPRTDVFKKTVTFLKTILSLLKSFNTQGLTMFDNKHNLPPNYVDQSCFSLHRETFYKMLTFFCSSQFGFQHVLSAYKVRPDSIKYVYKCMSINV